MPWHLYADATASVPVRFEVDGLGERVKIEKVLVSFYCADMVHNHVGYPEYLGYVKRFEHESQFGVGDGFEENGRTHPESSVYTAWIPTGVFRNEADLIADTTERGYFVVTINRLDYRERVEIK
ncbi:MAG: hypothetical protein ACOCYP_07080 [Planctomycetota bacterium]